MNSGGSDDFLKDNVSSHNSNFSSHSDENIVIQDDDIDMEALNNLRSEAGLSQLNSSKNAQLLLYRRVY
ncbi:hypothetical protein ACS0PU_000037 [Formica fusca]